MLNRSGKNGHPCLVPDHNITSHLLKWLLSKKKKRRMRWGRGGGEEKDEDGEKLELLYPAGGDERCRRYEGNSREAPQQSENSTATWSSNPTARNWPTGLKSGSCGHSGAPVLTGHSEQQSPWGNNLRSRDRWTDKHNDIYTYIEWTITQL